MTIEFRIVEVIANLDRSSGARRQLAGLKGE
jgi:hypothetical protein